jgi:hypothetical protein
MDLKLVVETGVNAYQLNDYKKAIDILLGVIDQDPRNWRGKLYLAMSYFRSGEMFLANQHFRFLRDNCTDAEIRQKAETALRAMSGLATTAMPQMTCEMRKPVVVAVPSKPAAPAESDSDEDPDIVWVEQENTRNKR